MARQPSEGIGLEARVQRVFLAQGMLAERRLQPSADAARRLVATDIDVLVSEYSSGFHLTRRHAECKGGKAPVLDRVLWLHGVRSLVGADASYLVMKEAQSELAQFARRLQVELLGARQLEEWENALGVPENEWPCRSDYQVIERARGRWRSLSGSRDADEQWRLLREVLAFIEVESWLSFEYRHLNRLLRFLASLAESYDKMKGEAHKELCCRYCISSLLVRASQYLLAICRDVAAVGPSDRKSYLLRKLTFGDQNPEHMSSLIETTVTWVRRVASEKGAELPADLNHERLFQPPSYGEEFVGLVQRLLEKADQAVALPVAVEVEQFNSSDLGSFERLRLAAETGDELAAVLKGYVVRTLPLPAELLATVGQDLKTTYTKNSAGKSGKGTAQLRLDESE